MTAHTIIRKAGFKDLERIYQFMCELEEELFDFETFRQIYEANILHPDHLYCVSETEGRVTGFISFHVQPLLHHCGLVGEIQEFYIDKDFRNRGIGSSLMAEVKRHAEARGLKSIEVTSNRKRVENVGIYERLGFTLSHNKFTISRF